MKNRIFSILMILVLSASVAIAQDQAKMSFGILGGVNFQNLNGKLSNGDKLEDDMLLGFHGGVNVQIPIAPEFYFQPGLMYAIKGAKKTATILGTKYTDETKISYVEMPLNLVYKGALGNGFVMLGFGPYVAYGISGKETFAGKSISFEKGVDFNSFDAGANIFFGFEMASGLFVQLDTQFGMLKVYPEDGSSSNKNSTAKNTGFGLSLGYRF